MSLILTHPHNPSKQNPQKPYPAPYAPYHQHGSHGQPHNITDIHACGSHTKRESQQIPHRQIEQPISRERYRHDDFYVLYATQHPDRNILNTIRQLKKGGKYEQRRGYVYNLGIRRKECRQQTA